MLEIYQDLKIAIYNIIKINNFVAPDPNFETAIWVLPIKSVQSEIGWKQ